MSNAKQRRKNRETAEWLRHEAHTCSRCGERGYHYVSMPFSLQHVIDRTEPDGFWVCPNLYGPDGRRLEGV